MKILNVTQGSPEWNAERVKRFCASDAPAMMGASKYKTRDELIREKAIGRNEDITPETQKLFDRGHAAEAAIRPFVEQKIGAELYPATCVEGQMLASLDGMTMDGETLFEHKLWNQHLVAQMEAGELEPHYYWQLEHQCLVAGATRVHFVCSDGTPENCVYLDYEPVPGRAEKLLAGWQQFAEDVKSYQHVEDAPRAVAEVQTLPAVSVQVNGSIAIVSNLPLFAGALKDFISQIDMKPQTDEAFAEAEAAIKTLTKAQEALAAAKSSGLAQVATVDEMVRTVDGLNELARTTRLALEKMVKVEKENRRAEIVQAARDQWNAHITAQNDKLRGRVTLTVQMPDFIGVMKGKKTIASLRGAANDALAAGKIEANQQADAFLSALAVIDETAKGYDFLVRDVRELVAAAPEHLRGIIKGRIAEHEAKEAARLEGERARIRAEEEARARREAEAKAEEERQKIRAEEQAKARAEAEDRRRVEAHASQQRAESALESMAGQARPVTAPAAAVTPPEQARVAADRPGARIKLGELNAAIAPLRIDAAGLASLGFQPVATEGVAKIYTDLPRIVSALIQHLQATTLRRAA